MISPEEFYLRTRRDFLATSASGLGGLALAHMLGSDARAAESAFTHFAPRAKRCIFLFMAGAPSQLDLCFFLHEVAASISTSYKDPLGPTA